MKLEPLSPAVRDYLRVFDLTQVLHQPHFLARKLDGGELVLAIPVLETARSARTLPRFFDGKLQYPMDSLG
jgi:hypothetical protein